MRERISVLPSQKYREKKTSRLDVLRESLGQDLVKADAVVQHVLRNEGVSALFTEVAERLPDVSRHMQRVGRIATLVAVHNGLDQDAQIKIAGAGVLHDAGKLTIPDMDFSDHAVWEQEHVKENLIKVRPHAEHGAMLVRSIAPEFAGVIRYHHTWQHSPYPDIDAIRSAGDDPELEYNRELARFIAMADQYDAFMTRPKPHTRSPLPLLAKDYLRFQGTMTGKGRLRRRFYTQDEVDVVAIGHQLIQEIPLAEAA